HLISAKFEKLAMRKTNLPPWAIGELVDEYSATTSKEFAHYFFSNSRKEAEQGASMLAQSLTLKTEDISSAKINREKKIILSEIKEDASFRKIQFFIDQVRPLNANHKNPIIGSKKTISQFSKDQCAAHYRNLYSASNLIVVINGSLSKKQLKKISSAFEKLPQFKSSIQTENRPISHERVVLHIDDQSPEIELSINLYPSARTYQDALQWYFLTWILNLYIEYHLRDKKGLVYTIDAYRKIIDHHV
ncbi:MAG: hypothetical protein COU09_00005, partial [Candidatus Harrisonbacteria bacterium CG10_big_fil_rev_8_21_14_0_10_44_23]